MTVDLILMGLAVALDRLPLTAFTVVLPSKRGVLKGGLRVRLAGVPDGRGYQHSAHRRQQPAQARNAQLWLGQNTA